MIPQLAEKAGQFTFFQLVSLVRRYQSQAEADGLRVRYRAAASLAFQPAEVRAVEADPSDPERLVIETALLGLYGPSSPLPLYYTEDLLDDTPQAEVLRDFLDLFNHRAHELLQQIWEKYRFQQRITPATNDPLSEQLAALARLGKSSGYPFRYVDRQRLLPLTGLLAFNSSSTRVMERVLRYYFDLPQLKILPNELRYVPVPADQLTALGAQNCCLGEDMVLGGEVLDCSGGFGIEVENVPIDVARAFHPDRHAYKELQELIDFLSPVPLEFTLSFKVDSQSVPLLSLDNEAAQLGKGALLGAANSEFLPVRFG